MAPVLGVLGSVLSHAIIEKPLYLPRDEYLSRTWILRLREANVGYTVAALRSRESYRKQQALPVVLLRKFRVPEELLGVYGTKVCLK